MRELAKKVEQNIASIGTGGSRRYRDITTVPIGQVLRKVPGADGRGADSLAGDRPAENLSPAPLSDRAPAPGTLRAFDSGESARRWGRSVWGATFSRLGKNRIQALRDFTVGAEGINAPLRGAATYPPDRLKNTHNRDTDLRVEVPPGTPGIFIGDKSAWSWELELLLGRDLDFEVLEWGRAEDRWQGAIRILPPEAAV